MGTYSGQLVLLGGRLKIEANNRLQATAHNLSLGNGIRSLQCYSYTVGRCLNRDVGNKKMKILFTCLIVLAISTGCGTRTHRVADITKDDTIVLTKKTSQGPIQSFSIAGSGKINGQAEITLILNGKPYKTETLSGPIKFRWGGDWYSDNAEIRYTPVSVTEGNLKLKYGFND